MLRCRREENVLPPFHLLNVGRAAIELGTDTLALMVSAVEALGEVHFMLLVLIIRVRVVDDALGATIASSGWSDRARLLEVHRERPGGDR